MDFDKGGSIVNETCHYTGASVHHVVVLHNCVSVFAHSDVLRQNPASSYVEM